MKVAFIIESSNRILSGPAKEFYYGKGSRWISAVLDYLKECQFPQEDIYFLSFYNNRIIGFDEVVEHYPLQPSPSKAQQKEFAGKIFNFLEDKYPGAEVDLHVSKNISDHLIPLLKQAGIRFHLFADGVQLGMKPNVYKDLILQARSMKKMKELQKEKERLIAVPEHFTPHEAERILEQFGHLGSQNGFKTLFSELKQHLKAYKQQVRQSLAAKDEFYRTFFKQEAGEELQSFFEQIGSITEMFRRHEQLDTLKAKHGKLVAKFTKCLIKQGYVKNTENQISELLFLLQIALLKG
ncbi:hypothetical protein EHV15_34425 [Paenibacillus oralis]|uniref:Uncharacterized protein n=1 Tax=Paenibacillus oralis TaxID=2490856 RepID=A0A3P3T9I9_9BACL|nr:hypothetical protein [Paenibacillus oralis]RRJ54696.1 hypothetical protein EHV15_34425 [Paenibacillus oralis]